MKYYISFKSAAHGKWKDDGQLFISRGAAEKKLKHIKRIAVGGQAIIREN